MSAESFVHSFGHSYLSPATCNGEWFWWRCNGVVCNVLELNPSTTIGHPMILCCHFGHLLPWKKRFKRQTQEQPGGVKVTIEEYPPANSLSIVGDAVKSRHHRHHQLWSISFSLTASQSYKPFCPSQERRRWTIPMEFVNQWLCTHARLKSSSILWHLYAAEQHSYHAHIIRGTII